MRTVQRSQNPGGGARGRREGYARPDPNVKVALFQYPASDKKNVKPRCTVPTTGVNGIGMDAAGTLWVPQPGSGTVANKVLTFLPGCKLQSLALTNTTGQPSDIAFDSTKTAFVVDIVGTPSTSPGLIDVYPAGHTTPTRQLKNSLIFHALGIAIDKRNNVHLAFTDASSVGHVVKFAKGKGTGTLLNLTGLALPIGLEFDGSQNLIVTDLGAGAELIYAPPYSRRPNFNAHQQGCVGRREAEQDKHAAVCQRRDERSG
ncbi:MAG: hypothetical protein ABI346_05895 [Candidatus Baltobacteraceae bacterium]